MQADSINKVPEAESKSSYLRVATITNEKSPLFFLYIGRDEASIKFLLSTTISGIIAENLLNAQKLIRSENFSAQSVDVIIIDTDYNEEELRGFQRFLHTSGGASIPLIYNAPRLSAQQLHSCSNLVDDAIDLSQGQLDLAAKIDFLKKARAYTSPAPLRPERKKNLNLHKRIFDIVVASVLLLLALPLFVLIALAIKLESRGPVFYNAKRAGRGFKIFKFYKFRTMVVNADKKIEALAHLNQYGQGGQAGACFFKIANDPRITKVGRLLRNTSLDELPQLLNVLKGDMSLVGNRPLPLYEAATLTTNEFVERFMAPAGITGLWQIKKRGQKQMSIDERIHLDIRYARNASLLYDLWIMANTPAAILQKTDA